MKTLLTDHNSKLGEFIPSFNLPVLKTCPGKTNLCKVYCYAKRYHFAMSSIKKKLEYNYRASKDPSFVNRICNEINAFKYMALSRGGSLSRIRLHSSGDFYNQEYLNKWIEIIRMFPEITFTTYTRSYMLKFEDLPSNLSIFYSVDGSTIYYSKDLKRSANIVPRKEFDKYYLGKHIYDRNFVCKSKCKNCKLCYNSKSNKNVIFIRH